MNYPIKGDFLPAIFLYPLCDHFQLVCPIGNNIVSSPPFCWGNGFLKKKKKKCLGGDE